MSKLPTDTFRNAINKAGESEEAIYDAIMAEGKLVLTRFEDDGDPYAMHKAFEWMKQEIENRIG